MVKSKSLNPAVKTPLPKQKSNLKKEAKSIMKNEPESSFNLNPMLVEELNDIKEKFDNAKNVNAKLKDSLLYEKAHRGLGIEQVIIIAAIVGITVLVITTGVEIGQSVRLVGIPSGE
jgi:hypothetical protein